jgi:hypothetical protein
MALMHRLLGLALLLIPISRAAIERCGCDTARPETLKARECSLCREAEKQAPENEIFFLRDANPIKKNRWLALPRKHGAGLHHLDQLSAQERNALWTAAIGKAKSLWGDDWGVAYNGDKVRTQCHLHIHVGKLLKGVETGKPITVYSVAQIPVPQSDGLWIHPHGKGMHVHQHEQTCETVLLR